MRRALTVTVVLFASSAVRADAVPFRPTPTCVPGAFVARAGADHHSRVEYCAPRLAPAEGCAEGYRREIAELEIVVRSVSSRGSGRLASDERRPSTYVNFAEARAACDAPDDEVPAALAPGSADFLDRSDGPRIAAVPSGCHRVTVWVVDPSVRCETAPEPPPSAAAPAAEAPPPSPAPSAAPAAEPAEPASSTGCSAVRSRGPGSVPWFGPLLVVLASARRSRAGRSARLGSHDVVRTTAWR